MSRSSIRKTYTAIQRSRMNLMEIIRYLGMQNNILFCLDAGAPQGVEPQHKGAVGTNLQGTWLDLSGNNNNFTTGGTISTTTNDVLFNGQVGGLSENEYFTAQPGATNAHLNDFGFSLGRTWHQNNGVFSWIGVFDPTTTGVGVMNLLNNMNGVSAAADNGIGIWYNTSLNTFNFISDINTGAADAQTTTLTCTGLWQRGNPRPFFGGVAYNEATPNVRLRCCGFSSSTATTASVNVTNAAFRLALGAEGDGSPGLTIHRKYFMAACWSRQLAEAEMSALYQMLKLHRFPSMP